MTPKAAEAAPGRNLWFVWMLASTVGVTAGWPVYVALGSSMDLSVAGYLAAGVSLCVAGTLQSQVLRRLVARTDLWALANLAAIAIVGVVISVDMVDAGEATAVLGTVVGVSQWLILRGQFSQAGWWGVASAVGWVGGGVVSALVSGIAAWALIGAVYGGVTGLALVWLLRRPLVAA